MLSSRRLGDINCTKTDGMEMSCAGAAAAAAARIHVGFADTEAAAGFAQSRSARPFILVEVTHLVTFE